MKKVRTTKLAVVIILSLVLAFSFSTLGFAATEPILNNLVVENNTSGGSGSLSVGTISDNMELTINSDWDSIKFNPVIDADSTVSVSGNDCSYIGSYYAAYNLPVGTSTFAITVTNGEKSHVYNLAVTKKANLDLNKVMVTGAITQTFNKPNQEFAVTVPNSDTSVTVSAAAASDNATVTVDGQAAGSATVDLTAGKVKTVLITVSANGSSDSKTYAVNITRLDADVSTDATLSGLDVAVSGTSLLSNFSSNQENYTITVPYNVASYVNFTPRTNNSKATVTVDGTAVKSGYSVSINAPSSNNNKTVKVVVTAGDLLTTKTYNVTLQLDQSGASDATLKNLSARGNGTYYGFTSNFNSTTYSYNLKVPNNVTSVNLSAAATSNTSQIYITDSSSNPLSGNTSYSSSSTGNISFSSSVYNKYAYIHVRSANGTTKTYTVYITRNSSTSDNYDLRGLNVQYSGTTASLLPSFSTNTTKYYVCIPRGNSSVTITPTASDSNATITVDGSTVSSGSRSSSISVPTGSSGKSISVKVTAPSGYDSQTYTVVVYRAAYTSGTDCDANDIAVRAGKSSSSLSTYNSTPEFSSSTTSYRVNLDESYRYVAFKVKASDSDGRIFAMYDNTVVPVDDSSYSNAIKISDSTGTNGAKITIRVYSANYSRYKDYVYTIYNNGSKNNDYYLSSMTVKADGSSKSISPSFYKSTKNYSLNVNSKTNYITIRPTANDSYATITVNGKKTTSGSDSSNIYLSSNTTVIPVIVTAGNGDTFTYSLVVTKGQEINKKVVLRLNSKTYLVNGKASTLLAAPYIFKDRTMVPLRMISEEFGATVDWAEKTKTITINKDGKTLVMVIGKTSAYLDVPPVVKNYTTFVPVRYVTEQLGATVDWNGGSQEIVITD